MRIGLYGGTFDPIHCGHLMVARAACEELGLDRLCFIPAAHSPFKPSAQPTAGDWRLRMLRVALAGCPEFDVSDLELRRGGVSFTVDTVTDFKDRYAQADLVYLIGMDHLATLTQWKDADRLASLVDFAVIPRPGVEAVEPPGGFRVTFLRGTPVELSSSTVRERCRRGLPLEPFVPPGVAELIRRYHLYSE